MMVLFLPITLFILQTTFAAELDEACNANSECTVQNSNCQILSPSCGKGTCKCYPGFEEVEGHCKRRVMLGFTCNAESDHCTGENIECTSSRCTCTTGYLPGLKGYDCISNMMKKRHNVKCSDNVECYYNSVCEQNRCQCYPGFKPVGDYDCTERQVGDACVSDQDCLWAPNTACANGFCSCITGYKRAHYLNVELKKLSYVCIMKEQVPKVEGEPCNITSTVDPVICRIPYVCLSCNNEESVCARFSLGYAHGETIIPSVNLITFLFLSFFFVN